MKSFLQKLLPEQITFPKKRIIFAGILTAVLLVIVAINLDQFIAVSPSYGILLYILSLLLCLLLGLFTAARLQFSKKVKAVGATVLFCLTPVVSITMVEALNNKFVYDLSVSAFLFNWIFYGLFYGAFYAASGSYRVTVILFNALVYPFALANHFLYTFRGTVFVPSDFSGITTAQNVVSTYEFRITGQMAISFILLAFVLILGSRLPTPAKVERNTLRKAVGRTVCGALFVIVALVYFLTDFFAAQGIAPDFWNQNRGYHNTGFFPNFMLNTKYLYYGKPSGYNANEVDGIVKNGTAEQVPTYTESSTTPNIICIMNESFSDLKVLGDFTTNQDYMPFYNSLTENTVKGNLYVPVNGAGTSNTEFEFLTGCSTSFLPSGSNAYMSYVKYAMPSLVSTVTNQGYTTRAIHPYYGSGWNRTTVYDLFGFSNFHSLGAFVPMSIMREYQNSGYDVEYLNQMIEEKYPDQGMMIRQYISDSYDYRAMINNYKNSNPTKPYFAFNITMQNHGGYTTTCSNFQQDVYVTSPGGEYPKTNAYLSLIKKSDDAFKELIEYFSTVDEPTVICMFGDHQPGIETEFIEDVMGKSVDDLTVEEEQKRYVTPFVIWANYNIGSTYVEKISVNYLSTLVASVAGLPMSSYQTYLYNLYKQIPVIDNVGYIDKNGNYYLHHEQSEYSTLLSNYEKVQYNLLFDYENRRDDLFDYNAELMQAAIADDS